MASESEDEASGSGSYYETSSGEEDEQDQEEEDEEEDEPVLKYGRFAKDVVNSLSQMVPSGVEGEPKNVIVCMAVHPKVPPLIHITCIFTVSLVYSIGYL